MGGRSKMRGPSGSARSIAGFWLALARARAGGLTALLIGGARATRIAALLGREAAADEAAPRWATRVARRRSRETGADSRRLGGVCARGGGGGVWMPQTGEADTPETVNP